MTCPSSCSIPAGTWRVVKGIAFTPDGRQLVSAGDDKVVRVWDWQAGKTVRIIRGQVGPGDRGQDLRHGAVARRPLAGGGGWMTHAGRSRGHIRLYDFATGELVALLKGHTNIVNSLAFSPDGGC